MHIEHIAIWVADLERMRTFYETYFNGRANPKYSNPGTGFTSYFISFDSGTRLEIMHRANIGDNPNTVQREHRGYVHLAIAVGSKAQVNALTEILRQNGCAIIGEPRTTGDGYYESVVLDPDGNRLELTV